MDIRNMGLLIVINEDEFPAIENGKPFSCGHELQFVVAKGAPNDFYHINCIIKSGRLRINVISEAVYNIFVKYQDEDELEFIPVKLYNDGKCFRYYIIHFLRIYDIADKENSDILDSTILRLAVHYDQIRNHNIITCPNYLRYTIISETVRKEFKK